MKSTRRLPNKSFLSLTGMLATTRWRQTHSPHPVESDYYNQEARDNLVLLRTTQDVLLAGGADWKSGNSGKWVSFFEITSISIRNYCVFKVRAHHQSRVWVAPSWAISGLLRIDGIFPPNSGFFCFFCGLVVNEDQLPAKHLSPIVSI